MLRWAVAPTERAALSRASPVVSSIAVFLIILGPLAFGTVGGLAFRGENPSQATRAPSLERPTHPAFHPAPTWPGWDSSKGRPSPNLPKDIANTVSLATASCTTSYPPWAWLAYDPLDNSFWVATPSSCVDVISGTPSYDGNVHVTASYAVGLDPFGVAIDTATGNVYVTNTDSNNVTVIDGATGVTVANIPVGKSPYGVAYDSSTKDVYVANGGSDNLSVISGSTEKVVASVGVGTSPIGVAADPSTGQLFVANNGSANVSVLSTSNNTVVANLNVGKNPYGVALDNASDQIYITNRGSDNISVIDAWDHSIVATIGAGMNPEGVAYNPVNQLVWVGANFFTVLINTTTQSVLGYLATDPSGVAVNPNTGVVCVTNTANATLRCIEYPNPIYPGYSLQFVQSGLPPTANWSVTLAWPGYYRSTERNLSGFPNTVIWFYVFAGSPSNYTYVIPPADGYYPTDPTHTVSVSTDMRINVTFVPRSGTYQVTFAEVGLPAGAPWTATLGGVANRSSGAQITFREPNGTYPFSISGPLRFDAQPAAGSLGVNGSAILRNITFVEAPTFGVLFSETGLPSGLAWYVDLNGAWGSNTTPSIEFRETNGTYNFQVGLIPGYNVSPTSGSLQVRGNDVSRAFLFSVTQSPLSANFSYQIEYATCRTDGGVTNYVLLGAEAAGGTVPYSYTWSLPTGVSSGALTDTTTTFGQNNSVTLTVTDSAHSVATRSARIGMELPPCAPPARNGSPSVSAAPLSFGEWAIVGLSAAFSTSTGVALWLALRGRGGRPPPK